jgi:hypothetical protein
VLLSFFQKRVASLAALAAAHRFARDPPDHEFGRVDDEWMNDA